MSIFKFISHNIEDTRKLGMTIGEKLESGDVLALSGELGAGKTALTKAIAAGLGIKDEGDVISPSFNIILSYQARIKLHHVDLYRIKDPQELVELGIDECMYGEGASVIEWADMFPGEMPAGRLDVKISCGDEPQTRYIEMTSMGERHGHLLEEIQKCL